MKKLHPVFHVVKLRLAPSNQIVGRSSNPPLEPIVVNGESEYEVEKILDSRIHYQKLQFLVTWKGYGQEENAWVKAGDIMLWT